MVEYGDLARVFKGHGQSVTALMLHDGVGEIPNFTITCALSVHRLRRRLRARLRGKDGHAAASVQGPFVGRQLLEGDLLAFIFECESGRWQSALLRLVRRRAARMDTRRDQGLGQRVALPPQGAG